MEVAINPTIEPVDSRIGSPQAKQLTQSTALSIGRQSDKSFTEQDTVFPTASPSHQEIHTSLLTSSTRGQTEKQEELLIPQLVTVHAKLIQLCLTLCIPMDHSLFGSSVHGILQARILEWVAISSSRGSSQHKD